VPVVKKIHRLERAQYAFLNHSKTPVFTDSSGNIIPGNWRNATEADEGLRNLHRISGNRYTYEAGSSRSDFKDYLNNEGQVPWQWDHVRSCGQKL